MRSGAYINLSYTGFCHKVYYNYAVYSIHSRTCVESADNLLPYSGKFSWVQNFAEKPLDPSVEILVVIIFVGAGMPRRRAGL